MPDSKFIYETKSTDDVITAYSKNFGKNSLSLCFLDGWEELIIILINREFYLLL